MKKTALLLLLAASTLFLSNTNSDSYPQTYFRSPVDHKPLISGTFGELRPNHFHSGIDIKSKYGKIGDPLYASAEGYVSRIKVQASGYGKALYIDHPNGYTTVYAHMDKFMPEVEQYVREQQQINQSFFVDLNPAAHQFKYDQGQKVGTMGNTGRSSGPHIHFEIRNTATEEPINPLLFGIKITDNIAPKLHQIKVYPLNDKHETLQPFVKNIGKGKSGRYYVGGDTLTIDAWRMGVGIKAYDHMNGTSNWNGVYAIETFVDDRLVHKTEFEKFHFDNTRYINSHTDFREKLLNKAWFNRCYRLPGNDIPMYPVLDNDGVFDLTSKTQEIRIVVHDASGNHSEVKFWVRRKSEISPQKMNSYNYFLPYNEPNWVDRDDMYLHFPKGVLYENLYLNYNASPDNSADTYSNMHHIHNKQTPIHSWYQIGIKAKNVPEHKRDKAIIALCEGSKKPVSHGGEWQGDYLVAEARDLGGFCVMIDDTPPTITPTIFKENLKGYSKIQFKLKDNYKTSRKLDTYTWNGYIDNQWVLFVPNPSKSVITHRFDKNLSPGKHTFRLEVKDERGNLSVFEREFLR